MTKKIIVSAAPALATGLLFGAPVEAATDHISGADTVIEIYAGADASIPDMVPLEDLDFGDAIPAEDGWQLAQTIYGGTGGDGILDGTTSGGKLNPNKPKLQTPGQPRLNGSGAKLRKQKGALKQRKLKRN